MSEDTIKTKKKDKSTWKSLCLAVAAVGGLAITIAKELNKNRITYITVPHGELRKEAQQKKWLKKNK